MDHHRYANLVADFKPQMVADFSDTTMFARKTGEKNIYLKAAETNAYSSALK